MSEQTNDMSDLIEICRELERRVGDDAPLRLRTLVEMLMIELERPIPTPRERRPATANEP